MSQAHLDLTGGQIGGIDISANSVSVGSVLQLKDSGQITGSNVLFTGGTIGGFTLDGHSLTTTGVEINDSTQNIFISSSAFKVDHSGNITASNVDLSGKITSTEGEVGGFTIDVLTKLKVELTYH